MKISLLLKSTILATTLIASIVSAHAQSSQQCLRISGFYAADWGPSLPVADIPTEKLTHVNLAFLLFDDNGNLNASHVSGVQSALVNKAHNDGTGTKVLISIGGGAENGDFRGLIANPAGVNNFINNVVNYVNQHNLDGVDLDWEHWTTHGQPNPTEANQLVDLLQRLKAALPAGKELSTDVFTGGWNGVNYSDEIDDHVDAVNAMAYDYTGQWASSPIAHHARWSDVFAGMVTGAENIASKYDNDKTLLGIPFYGKVFRNGSNTNAPLVPYRDIINNIVKSQNVDVNLGDSTGHTLGGDRYFWETPNLVRQKANFAKDNGYAGVMIWELRQDTLDANYKLLDVINEVIDPNCNNTDDAGFVYPIGNDGNIQLPLAQPFSLQYESTQATRVNFAIRESGNTNIIYQADANAAPNDSFNLSNINFSGINNPATPYSVTATSFDANNQELSSHSIEIMFVQFWPPATDITSHNNGDTIALNQAQTIAVDFVDGSTDLTKVEFYVDNVLLHTDVSAPYSYDWTPNQIGNYTITATAYKQYNQATDPVAGSDSVTVTVEDTGTEPCGNTGDPNAVNYPAWSASTTYTGGNRVNYNGLVYEAKWWQQGQAPEGNNAWTLISDIELPWSASEVYVGGDEANHNGRRYRANFWNTNAQPDTHPSEWTDIGAATCQ